MVEIQNQNRPAVLILEDGWRMELDTMRGTNSQSACGSISPNANIVARIPRPPGCLANGIPLASATGCPRSEQKSRVVLFEMAHCKFTPSIGITQKTWNSHEKHGTIPTESSNPPKSVSKHPLGEIHPKVSPGWKRDLIEASNNSLWRREDRSWRGTAVQRPATR